jgi:PAS domain S-box-containing protein
MEMEGEKIRILLIEDNPGDARLLRELLAAKDGASFNLEHEDRLSTALARLAQGDTDVILLDLSLPDSQGLDGLNKICAQAPKVPIVVLSGLSDEAVAINAVQEGAQDYLVKGSVDSDSLVRSLHYAIERQHFRVALRESESRYRLLADNVADVIWTADLRGRINYVSPSVKNFLGYTVDETVKLEMKDILTSDSAEQAKRLIRDQIVLWNPWVKHTPLSLTLEHIRKDGSTLWSEVRLSFLCNEKGIVIGILGVTRDITDRKKAEEAISESETQYRSLVETASKAGLGITIVQNTKDKEAVFVFVNDEYRKISGYSRQELLGMSSWDTIPPENLASIRERYERRQKGEALPSYYETTLLRKDGTRLPIETSVSVFTYRGKPATVSFFKDITERKKAGEALRKSEALYRLLADNAGDVIWTMDMKGRITYVSPSAKRLFGYSIDEMMALKGRELLTPASAETARKVMEEELAIEAPSEQNSPRSVLLEHVRKDGSTVWAEVMMSFLRDEQGRIKGVLGVTRDMTERQKSEKALRQSEQRYRLLAENVKDIIWTRDMNLKLTYTSPSVYEISGYSVDEVMSMSLEESMTPASLELVRPILAKVLASEGKGQGDLPEVIVLEVELIHKDGSAVPVEMKINLLHDSAGRPTGFLGVTRDITERKKAQEALRESQEELQAIFDSSMNGIALLDLEGKLIRVNKRVLEVGGYDVEEISGKPLALLNMFTPESIERMASVRDMILSGKEVAAFECEVCTKSGTKMSLEINVGPFFLKGQLFGSVAVMRDITERKRAEEALRESEERFRTVFEGTSLGIALVDFNGKALSINPAFEQMTGYNMEEFKEIEGSLKYLHPDDAMVDAKLYIEMLKGKRDYYTVEKRYIRKDGEIIWGRQNLSVVRDAEGKPKYFVAMVEDITARKKMEEALRQSEERYRELFENANDIIYTHDLAGNFISVNKAAELVTGYTRDEVIGMNIARILTPESMELARQMIARKVSDGGQTRYELEIVTKDGHKVLLEVNTRLIYEGGKPVGTQGIARDITERKKMEEELRRLSDAVRMSTDSIVITDIEANIVDVNEATIKIQGASSKSDLIRLKASDFIAPEDLEKALGDLSRLVEKEHVNDIQYNILTRDGRRVLVETNASLMRGRNGEPVGVVAVTRDVTERKRMEDALKQSEQNYRVLFESTLDGLIVLDAETMKLLLANKTAAIIGGVDSPDDLIGLNALDMLPSDESDRARRLVQKEVFEKDLHNVHEYQMVDTDGKEKWVSVVSTRTEFQGRLAALVSIRDITERKMMEEEKRRLEEQLLLAGRLAAVGELAAGVAHELNNPLTAIRGFAQLLTARNDLDETLRKDLASIDKESQRAAKITQNLLSFARRHEPEKHPISINDVIENILEMQDHQMKVNNIELEVELDPDLPKTMADFHQMQQVFMNIVNNAEQAMLETHGKSRLLIKTQRSGKMVQITFADNGPGISEENLKRIFDPFFTTKEVGKGTGLGLSICYGLVEAHGGRIYARSKLGQGATFVVEMPIVSHQDQLVAEAALLNPSSRGVKWNKPG